MDPLRMLRELDLPARSLAARPVVPIDAGEDC
jgi:hypothetical protein